MCLGSCNKNNVIVGGQQSMRNCIKGVLNSIKGISTALGMLKITAIRWNTGFPLQAAFAHTSGSVLNNNCLFWLLLLYA